MDSEALQNLPEPVTVNQIYTLVNNVFEQMTGLKTISVVDTKSLVAMGREINNLGKNELWLNSFSRRIGLTIDSYRVYNNKFADLYRNQMEWGALVQKIDVEMPEAVLDETYNVGNLNGKSVDQWIINNPKVHQRFFDKETPYSFFTTIQKKFLKESFLSASAMEAFINQIFGKVQNKIEFVLEELARMAVANFVINLKPSQELHLVTMYNNTSPENSVTTTSAMYDPNFLRWSIGMMNNVSRKMESMSVLYNSEGLQRFTPQNMQRFYILSDFITQVETVVAYAAFHQNYVTKKPDIAIPYWQATASISDNMSFEQISQIQGTVEKQATPVIKKNLIGIMFDRDAIGTFREEEDVETTTINARALYYNTFWHERQLWFNDMSENGVAFYLD